MNIPVFLSCSGPYTKEQEAFKAKVRTHLEDYLGFMPRTLGETDYDPEEPLTACRRLMMECNGLITLAFRRYYVHEGWEYPDSPPQTKLQDKKTDNPIKQKPIAGKYFTSPWCQIEATMAFSLGLPILVFREKGVIEWGLLAKGIAGLYLPEEFDVNNPEDYLQRQEWKEIISEWGGWVRAVRRSKGYPPRAY